MSTIEFSAHDKSTLVDKIKTYFTKELHQDIGQFDAEFLLDFFSKEIGCNKINDYCISIKIHWEAPFLESALGDCFFCPKTSVQV